MDTTDPPLDPRPILLRPGTFTRFEGAVRYVEGLIRTRAPRPNWNRFPGLKPGAWGLLAPGAVITAGSGLSLGSGTVTLCRLDGTTLVPDGPDVTVYNNGPQVGPHAYAYGYGYSYDPGTVVPLEWTEAGWSTCVCQPPTEEHCDDGQVCVTVGNACSPFGPLPGATVKITRHFDGKSFGTCTTDSTGKCCLPVPGDDDYDVTISKSGCSTLGMAGDTPIPVHVNCGETVNVGRGLYCGTPPINACYTFTVTGCLIGGGPSAYPLPGAQVNITGPKGGGGTTDSSGKYTFCTDKPGMYSYSISKARFKNPATGTFTIPSNLCTSGDNGTTVGLSSLAGVNNIADGYICCFTCADPIPDTLVVTGPVGAVTVKWCGPASVSAYFGRGTFSGPVIDFTPFPGPGCHGPPVTGTVPYLATLTCDGRLQIGVFEWNSHASGVDAFDRGDYVPGAGLPLHPPPCAYVYNVGCSTALAVGGVVPVLTASSCIPYMASGTMTNATEMGTRFNGTYTVSE